MTLKCDVFPDTRPGSIAQSAAHLTIDPEVGFEPQPGNMDFMEIDHGMTKAPKARGHHWPMVSFFLPLVLLPLVQFSNQKQSSCQWCTFASGAVTLLLESKYNKHAKSK